MLDNTRTEVFWFQKFVSKTGAGGTLREERKEDKESFVP